MSYRGRDSFSSAYCATLVEKWSSLDAVSPHLVFSAYVASEPNVRGLRQVTVDE